MPVESKIDISKVQRAEAVVRSVLREELLALGTHLDGMVKRNIRDKNAINTSALVCSYAATTPSDVPGVLAVRVGTPLEYGNYIEHGTSAHMPPLQPIIEWVENKLNVVAVNIKFVDGKAVPTGKGVRQFSRIRNVDKRQAAIERIARSIQYSIARRGTKSRHVVKDALDAMGLTYTLKNYIYEIDTINSLAKNGNEFWSKVAARLN